MKKTTPQDGPLPDELIARLSTDQKLALLSGPPVTLPRLLSLLRAYNIRPMTAGCGVDPAIPGIRFSDGPRGVVMGHATCFPAAIARGATWDPQLEQEVAATIGREARLLGANIVASCCINVLRHPAWGRAQETFGEDPVHLAAMGRSHVRGLQRYVMACVKHYACNSIENARLRVDVRIDQRTLHEVYLPHFRACVEAGAASVMSAYNRVNGHWCGEHRELLTTILREQWGFDGFVMSDFVLGVRNGVRGFLAGLDLEMPFRWRFAALRRACRDGRIPQARLDDAVRRLLRWQLRFADPPEDPGPRRMVAGAAHRALARSAATRSFVLLRNEPVDGRPLLPLSTTDALIALIGAGAIEARTGDRGSSHVRARQVVTIADGLRAVCDDRLHVCDGRSLSRAVTLAAAADIAILVLGNGASDEGEYLLFYGGDRKRLGLRRRELRLLKGVLAVQPRTIVLLTGGAPIILGELSQRIPALMMCWYPGQEGGHAVADVLTGRAEPAGRLPCVWPQDGSQLPPFDPGARRIRYEYDHGQRWFDRHGLTPAWPLGFGLGYTTFRLSHLSVPRWSRIGNLLQVRIRVTNTGDRPGSALVQVWLTPVDSPVVRHPRWLAAFRRCELAPGASTDVALDIDPQRFRRFDPAQQRWIEDPLYWRLSVGQHAGDPAMLTAQHQRRDG